MAVSDYTPQYSGQQRGQPYLWQNPETGEVEYREGDLIDVGPGTEHSSIGHLIAKYGPMYGAPIGAAGLDALAGPVGGAVGGSSGAGSSTGSVAGYSPGLPTGPVPGLMPSVTPYTGVAPGMATAPIATATAAPAVAPTTAASEGFVGPTLEQLAAGGGAAAGGFGGFMDRWGPLIDIGAQVGGGIWQNQRSNKASKEALAQQQAATNAAMAENRAAFGPYMQMGGNAANALNYLSGFGTLNSVGGGAMPASATMPAPQSETPQLDQVMPGEGSIFRRILDRSEQQKRQEVARSQAPSLSQSSYVRLRDDDGQEMSVAPDIAEALIQRGARRV